jgi:hypothetical protein
MINTRNTLGSGSHPTLRALLLGVVFAIAALALLARVGSTQERDDSGVVEELDVFGQVVDAASGERLVGAWVGITGTDWGSISNAEGRFRIPDLQPGPLSLTVEQLGYETREWRGEVTPDNELLLVELQPRPVILEGLEVVTDRFRSRRMAATTRVVAYDASDLTRATERNALEYVRYRTSGIVSCNGRRGNSCVLVRGRSVEPVVYLDEAPLLGGLEYLETLQPWELHMIEVYGGGSHIRAYTPRFMERAAESRLLPLPFSN